MDANEKVRLFERDAYIVLVQRLNSVDTGRLKTQCHHTHIPPFDHSDLQPNSALHPSENVINVRIQMYGKLPSFLKKISHS